MQFFSNPDDALRHRIDLFLTLPDKSLRPENTADIAAFVAEQACVRLDQQINTGQEPRHAIETVLATFGHSIARLAVRIPNIRQIICDRLEDRSKTRKIRRRPAIQSTREEGAPLDPAGPIISLLFQDGSSDYILGILSSAGISHLPPPLTDDESYSNTTRKRAYRRRLAAVTSKMDQPSRLRMAEIIAVEVCKGSDQTAHKLTDALERVGWTYRDDKLIRLTGAEHAIPMKPSMNLTGDQLALLQKIVEVYGKGVRSPFILTETMDGSSLVYSGHPAVSVDATKTDILRLAAEGLLDYEVNAQGDPRGKPTARGIALITDDPPPPVMTSDRNLVTPHSPNQQRGGRVFIGHGRSLLWLKLRMFLTEKLGLTCNEFNEESPAGVATTVRLQSMLDNSQFAFLLMTADDTHADGTAHARENVIHEAGLFQGRLGFNRAIILLEEGCAEFSNIHGLGQIRFPKGDIDARFEQIREVLKREGIIS